jgi:hypothetical protein
MLNMTMLHESLESAAPRDPACAISLKDGALALKDSYRAPNFGSILTSPCRAVVQWSAILLPSEPLFDNLPPLRIAAVIYFAVFDLVAAVGLWLATPWAV